MSAEKGKKKLKSFGKNRKEAKHVTTYDADGNWIASQRQEDMRDLKNPLLDRYYGELQRLGDVMQRTPHSHQHLSNELAWEEEMKLFRQPLPTTIWINDTDPMAPHVSAFMKANSKSLVEEIPWYPLPGMGWRILADKTAFRKRSDMAHIRQFLIQQTALGTISRQEEVSMIPPFLLDVQPTDVCLDMCASPGSKTAQMLVALGRHKLKPNKYNMPFDYLTDGLVVANELDTKRANMLVHQVKRLRLLFPFALFTNHDGRYFPDFVLSSNNAAAAEKEEMRFDKVLCDVVCSGDGTIRKAPHVFKIWTPREGMNLQKTQIQLALRAAHLLKVGGRLVYSTCSLNPVENEAVVAQIVHRSGGAMKLVDARHLLPRLQCAPGMQSWIVTDHTGKVVETPGGNMHEALFPPHTPGGYSSPAVDDLDLSLCMRLFPSHCSGGGFFVAVLDKVKEYRIEKREQVDATSAEQQQQQNEDKQEQAQAPVSGSVARLGKRKSEEQDEPKAEEPSLKRIRRAPPQFIPPPAQVNEEITRFFEIKDFPMENLMIRAATGERELRVTAGSICSLVSSTAAKVLVHKSDDILIVSAGLRTFAHESLTKAWRIACEAAPLFPLVMKNSSRTLQVPLAFIEALIATEGTQKKLVFEAMEDTPFDGLRQQLQDLPVGPVLFVVHDVMTTADRLFYTVGLRARACVQLLVDHEDMDGLKLRLGLKATVTEVANE